MDFKVDALGPCRKHVTVKVPPERVKEEFDRQYDEVNDSIVMPGFRKGRAPRKILEKRFAETLGREVKEKLVEKAMEKLVEDKAIEPLRAPELDIEAMEVELDSGFDFEFDVLTKPEFETPEYKGLELELPAIELTDEMLDSTIDRLRQNEATLLPAEDDASIGAEDVLVIDWEALDGDSVEAHDENGYYLFGRGVLAGFVAEGLDEQLEGKSVGAEGAVEVRVGPDDPREELRDKTLQLKVEVKEIKRYVLPEIDEEFLKRHDFDDVEEMREEIGKQITRAQGRERDRFAEEQLVEKLVGGVEMSLPEEFVESELESWAQRKRMELQMENVEAEEIAKKIEAERADAKTSVENDMRRFFLLERIAEAEEVKVAEAEMLQAIQAIARATGRPEDEVLQQFRDGNRLAELASQVRQRKTSEIIRRHATIAEGAPDSEATPKKKPAKKKAKAASKKKSAAKAKDTPEEKA